MTSLIRLILTMTASVITFNCVFCQTLMLSTPANNSIINEGIVLPFTWNSSGFTLPANSYYRIEVYHIDENNNTNIVFSELTTSLSLIPYNFTFDKCKNYAWKVSCLVPNNIGYSGEYDNLLSGYIIYKQSNFYFFKTSCDEANLNIPVHSIIYWEFPLNNVPYVFISNPKEINFKYESPYSNDILKCQIKNWKNAVLVETEMPILKGLNYLSWKILDQLSTNEIYILEVIDGKNNVKTLKFKYVKN